MRFLIGLIGGALLVVLLAPDPARPGPARDWAQALGRAVSEVLRPPPPVAPAAVPEVTEAAPRAADSEPAATPIPRPPDPLPAARLAPEPTVAASASATPALVDSAPATSITSAADPASLMPASPAAADFALAPATEPAAPAAPTVAGADPGAAAAVWTPFHSERSAVGFADRLSREVDHPFRVERRGPGRYQVVVGYRDELERRSLMDQAAAATGLPL